MAPAVSRKALGAAWSCAFVEVSTTAKHFALEDAREMLRDCVRIAPVRVRGKLRQGSRLMLMLLHGPP
jgi:hypothetical protein